MDTPLSGKLSPLPAMPGHEKPPAPAERSSASASGEGGAARLAEVCAEFESLFIHQLLKEMRATIPKGGLLEGGNAEEVYTALLDAELARNLARRGGIGLAELTRRELGAAAKSAAAGGVPDKGQGAG
jgi:Rod binding domain-containing protein